MDREIIGLTDQEVRSARELYGDNKLRYKKKSRILTFIIDIIKEPMIVLLLVASVIYAIEGAIADSLFLGGAILLVAAISLYQEQRSHNALNALKKLTRPLCKVIRNAKEEMLGIDDIVTGDILIVEEGSPIPADGYIVRSNDFSVNESMLTGESVPVFKSEAKENNAVFRGTIVVSGLAYVKVTATGNQTKLGLIGNSINEIKTERSPLENNIRAFVKKMAIMGAIAFLIVWGIHYYKSARLLNSLLKSLTLAMSILPEEIPVAFTSFMALAALRLMKKGIIVKQMKTVETLGSATVICSDKTGTITQNKMTLAAFYEINTGAIHTTEDTLNDNERGLLEYAMWASEPRPFDPMEIALHDTYEKLCPNDQRQAYSMIHEYPLGGRPPMMTHVFENNEGNRIIAAKGAPEAIINVSSLSDFQKEILYQKIDSLSQEGYRILGVGTASHPGNDFPEAQQDFSFSFKGLIAFQDPPKENIKQVLQSFYDAGVEVKIITGDNAATTRSIARSIGFRNYEQSIDGATLMNLNDEQLEYCVRETKIFTRMFPEAKLRVINALKKGNEIVAMTGDGINDGPALKAAHIGIAMGKKGTEIAKEAAALILPEDDLSGMVEAIALGRRIYSNLKKAIRYIISIHIPIILSVLMPLVLGWRYTDILSPVHVIFLELIMGPTCSIIYENEPTEANVMQQKPRLYSAGFFNYRELSLSIIQGLVIAAASLMVYQYGICNASDEATIRTMIFTLLITANILLTLVNRSFYYSLATTLRYRNKLMPLIIITTVLLTTAIILIPPTRHFFGLKLVGLFNFSFSILLGGLSVIWIEAWKWYRRNIPARDR